jgi:hypothetical protein
MFRDDTNPQQRSLDLTLTIDPGFVNRRLVQTIVGDGGMTIIDNEIGRIPSLPEGLFEARIDHVYTKVALHFTKLNQIKTLSRFLADGNGHIFCSTEHFLPCPDVYEASRASSVVRPAFECEYEVSLDYSTEHIRGDTLRSQLYHGETLSVIARFHKKDGRILRFHPLVIGSPWLWHPEENVETWAMWHREEFYEHFVEDFAEFARISSVQIPESFEPMRCISEEAFKKCLASLLHDSAKKDWGGETSDHYTSHLHLGQRRVTAAFLLKGPSVFAPMTPAHLGKNGDQIYRLAQEPSQVLFVQHCHEITAAVRATLRAFAVQPFNPRRYCLIDGKDSFRLLRAYDLYDEALRLSRES